MHFDFVHVVNGMYQEGSMYLAINVLLNNGVGMESKYVTKVPTGWSLKHQLGPFSTSFRKVYKLGTWCSLR